VEVRDYLAAWDWVSSEYARSQPVKIELRELDVQWLMPWSSAVLNAALDVVYSQTLGVSITVLAETDLAAWTPMHVFEQATDLVVTQAELEKVFHEIVYWQDRCPLKRDDDDNLRKSEGHTRLTWSQYVQDVRSAYDDLAGPTGISIHSQLYLRLVELPRPVAQWLVTHWEIPFTTWMFPDAWFGWACMMHIAPSPLCHRSLHPSTSINRSLIVCLALVQQKWRGLMADPTGARLADVRNAVSQPNVTDTVLFQYRVLQTHADMAAHVARSRDVRYSSTLEYQQFIQKSVEHLLGIHINSGYLTEEETVTAPPIEHHLEDMRITDDERNDEDAEADNQVSRRSRMRQKLYAAGRPHAVVRGVTIDLEDYPIEPINMLSMYLARTGRDRLYYTYKLFPDLKPMATQRQFDTWLASLPIKYQQGWSTFQTLWEPQHLARQVNSNTRFDLEIYVKRGMLAEHDLWRYALIYPHGPWDYSNIIEELYHRNTITRQIFNFTKQPLQDLLCLPVYPWVCQVWIYFACLQSKIQHACQNVIGYIVQYASQAQTPDRVHQAVLAAPLCYMFNNHVVVCTKLGAFLMGPLALCDTLGTHEGDRPLPPLAVMYIWHVLVDMEYEQTMYDVSLASYLTDYNW